MKQFLLSDSQQEMVAQHIPLVTEVIRKRIRLNEKIYGLGYEELLQEGSIYLCQAVISYDPARADFPAFAKKVIYNGLICHIRKVYRYESRNLPFICNEKGEMFQAVSEEADDVYIYAQTVEVLDLLSYYAQQYTGVTKRGIEAIEKLVQGQTITEIARNQNVPPSHVGAWVSRAKKVLRGNKEFMSTIS